jgi:hypothetical protein
MGFEPYITLFFRKGKRVPQCFKQMDSKEELVKFQILVIDFGTQQA